MTPLAERLVRRIAATGPMTVAEVMAECLLDPVHGYYTTRDPLGRAGDFITAPEISQMFGELIGLALADAWDRQGRPGDVVLAELGPGRGTLMADALRAMAAAGLRPRPHLVEASPALRAVQAQTLAAHDPVWLDDIAALPDAPLLLIANEFFDALPVRQFLRDGPGWRERQVGVQDGALVFGLGGRLPVPDLEHRLADTRDGDMVETCAPARTVVAEIAGRLARQGGAALIIDYGDVGTTGDTLQALRAHRKEGPLDSPGEADLTAHVDFGPLAEVARAAGARPEGPVPQGVFLETLGITARAQALAARAPEQAGTIAAAHRRLTHPEEMGSLFKVLGLTPPDAPAIAGTRPMAP